MHSNSKTRLLEKLRDEIRVSIADPWLFPKHGNIKGFLGTGPAMLVAERPSTGRVGWPPRLLYSLLEKFNAGAAHLTDIIKSRGKVGEPYPADVGPHRRIFDRELEIVQPTLIVTFGQKVYDLLRFTLAGSGITIRHVWHYSYARRGADKAITFEKQLRDVLSGAETRDRP